MMKQAATPLWWCSCSMQVQGEVPCVEPPSQVARWRLVQTRTSTRGNLSGRIQRVLRRCSDWLRENTGWQQLRLLGLFWNLKLTSESIELYKLCTFQLFHFFNYSGLCFTCSSVAMLKQPLYWWVKLKWLNFKKVHHELAGEKVGNVCFQNSTS